MNDKGLTNIPSRRIFAPYFKARFQNMQNIITDSQILNYVPREWKTYYIAYIRQWSQWATGFVPMLHNKDFFATGVGASVLKLMVREIMNGGYRLDSSDELTQHYFEGWAKEVGLDEFLHTAFWHSNATGNAFIKINVANGSVYPTSYPTTRAFIVTNRKNIISRAKFIDRFVTNTVSDGTYWLMEDRVMLGDEPYMRIKVGKQAGTSLSPSWNYDLSYEAIPSYIKEEIIELYGDVIPNEWYNLPFSNLGVYNIKNESVAIAMSDVPGYSDATLHTALDLLYSIDFNYTSQQMDMYWGRTRVVIPKNMTPKRVALTGFGAGGEVEVKTGVSYEEAYNPAPLEDDVFTKVEMPNEEQSPIFIQPDMRGEEHKYIRDADLELLAVKIGLSTTTLASHLQSFEKKTATQVASEDDTTQKTVNNKRSLANIAINAMLKDVTTFYGWKACPDITWNRSSGTTADENRQLMEEYNVGVLPLNEYLKKRWRDLTEKEIDMWIEQLNQRDVVQDLFL